MTTTILEAAALRGESTVQRSARPKERRNSELPGNCTRGGDATWARTSAVRVQRVELRAAADGGSGLHFSGIASATESPYEMYDWAGPYFEVVSQGAFEKTLSRSDLDVPLVLGHDQMRRIARTTNGSLALAELDEGLDVDAPQLNADDHDVQYIGPKLRDGLIDEMSFAFRIDSGIWSPDYTEFRITQVDIHRGDVAIVGYGANPATSAALRSAPPAPAMSRAKFLTYLDD